MTRKILFRRDFRGYTGGEGKVWDYFTHAQAHPAWQAAIHLAPGGVREENPWLAHAVDTESAWRPGDASALFLAGNDWQAHRVDQADLPVINLIQGLRHADEDNALFQHLGRRAVRICVSRPVADAILATGQPNGPVLVIPAAVDLSGLPNPAPARSGVFIGATKQPELGRDLATRLRADGHEVTLADQWLSRADYLSAMAACRIAVPLPLAEEGFFLPGLESMALGCATVAVDCIGNREYLRPGINALSPPANLEALAGAVAELHSGGNAESIIAAGLDTAAAFDLPGERMAFHSLLDSVDSLWTA